MDKDKRETSLQEAEDELIKKLNKKFEEMVGEGEHLEIIKIRGKDQLLSLIDAVLGEDKDRDKIVKCMPCLLDSFKSVCARLRGDHIAYAGAVAMATLMTIIEKDVTSRKTEYSDRFTATLLKFAEIVDIIDSKELSGIKAREYLKALDKDDV